MLSVVNNFLLSVRNICDAKKTPLHLDQSKVATSSTVKKSTSVIRWWCCVYVTCTNRKREKRYRNLHTPTDQYRLWERL